MAGLSSHDGAQDGTPVSSRNEKEEEREVKNEAFEEAVLDSSSLPFCRRGGGTHTAPIRGPGVRGCKTRQHCPCHKRRLDRSEADRILLSYMRKSSKTSRFAAPTHPDIRITHETAILADCSDSRCPHPYWADFDYFHRFITRYRKARATPTIFITQAQCSYHFMSVSSCSGQRSCRLAQALCHVSWRLS